MHWNRFPRVVMESAALETPETLLDIGPSQPVCADPGLRKVMLSYMMFTGSFQSQQFYGNSLSYPTLQSNFFQSVKELLLP